MGVSHDLMTAFEQQINKQARAQGKLKSKAIQIKVVFIPVPRDQLVSGLLEGIGDVAAANLTVTAQRAKQVDFAVPFTEATREFLVTGPQSRPVENLEQLSDREVAVRKSSSYHESLLQLNQRLKAAGRKPVKIILVPEELEAGDLAEMISAGIYQATVMDGYLALFWQKIFANLKVHEDVVLRQGASIAFAVRKNSPQLKKALDGFASQNKVGTTFTNIVLQKYLRDTRHVQNALSGKSLARFRQTLQFLQKYASQYQFDWLLIAAQAFQESGLDQAARSPVGAVGVMQVMPETASGAPIGIPQVHELEHNIHAGVKYLRFMTDQYFDDPAISPVDRHLFAFASYNAGPNRINRLRAKAAQQGLNPNKWFQNVEVVAARYVGAETTQYVSNIFKYYVAYKHFQARQQKRLKPGAPGPA
jgi:membrane-bound lytic murein transglycosylase MltF